MSLTVTATDAAAVLTTATKALTVNPGAPNKLLLTGPSPITAGTCSTAYTVTSADSIGNPSPVTGATTINLLGGTGLFYSDVGCGSQVVTATIGAAASSTTFYYKDTTAETFSMSAGATGLTIGTKSVTIDPATAVSIALSGPASLAAGSCSTAYTVTSKDTFGNASPLSSSTGIVLSGNGNGVFYSDVGCTAVVSSVTISAATSSKVFYFKDNSVEVLTLVANSTLGSVNQGFTVNPASPTVLTMAGISTATAGTCSGAITVTSRDSLGNPSPVSSQATVVLSGAGTGGAFYTDSGCGTGTANAIIGVGSSSVLIYYKNNNASSYTFGGTATGFTAPSLSVTVNPGAPSVITVSGPATITAGVCSTVFTITTRDGFNNASAVTGSTTIALGGKPSGFYTDSSCTSPVGGNNATVAASGTTTTFYFKDTTAEALTLTGASGGFATGSSALTVNPNTPNKLDNTFGTAGLKTVDFNGFDDEIYSSALQSDGALVVVGYSTASNGTTKHFTVSRFLSDGTLDGSFGTAGSVIMTIGSGNSYATSVAIQSDGNIVAAGYSVQSGNDHFTLVRLSTLGVADTTFGTSGTATSVISGTSFDRIRAMVLQPLNGRIVVGGSSFATGSNENFAIARYWP